MASGWGIHPMVEEPAGSDPSTMDSVVEPGQPSRAPRHAEVARLAYALYTMRGSCDGHDVRNWLDAERRLLGQHGTHVHGRPTSALGSSHSPP